MARTTYGQSALFARRYTKSASAAGVISDLPQYHLQLGEAMNWWRKLTCAVVGHRWRIETNLGPFKFCHRCGKAE